jgi:hypothetical protein
MSGPAFLFDLYSALMDSVRHHVLAWKEALARDGIRLPVWRIHRRVGMSGGLLANAIAARMALLPRIPYFFQAVG